MKKQIIASTFLLIWLLAGFLPVLLLLEGKRKAHEEFAVFKTQYKATNCIQFQLSNKEYQRKLEGKEEIRIQGELYDIISVKNANHSLIVKCIADNYENILEATFADLNSGKKNNTDKIKTFTKDVKPMNERESLALPFLMLDGFNDHLPFSIASVFLSQANPPPERFELAKV